MTVKRCSDCVHRGRSHYASEFCLHPKARSLVGEVQTRKAARYGANPRELPEGHCGVSGDWFTAEPPPPPSLWQRIRRWWAY